MSVATSTRVYVCWHDGRLQQRLVSAREHLHLQLRGIEAEGAHVPLRDDSRGYQALHKRNRFVLIAGGHLRGAN